MSQKLIKDSGLDTQFSSTRQRIPVQDISRLTPLVGSIAFNRPPSAQYPVGDDLYFADGSKWIRSEGPQGDQGAQGAQGPQGPQGDDGPQGDIGPQGAQGPPNGPQGSQGVQGSQGAQGPQGSQGPQGDDGSQGPQGDQGVQGSQGEDGPQGSQGGQGDDGPQGSQGPQGEDGPQGPQGAQGDGSAVTLSTVGSLGSQSLLPGASPQFGPALQVRGMVAGAGVDITSIGATDLSLSINSSFRECDAIVSTSGAPGTYPLISAAVAAGNMSICVESGTYIETTQISLPAGTIIKGERAPTTIVVFAGLAVPGFFADFNGGVAQTTGTVSIPVASSTVTGVGTLFLSLTIGSRILLGGAFYTISAIATNLSLTISESYRGKALSGSSFAAYRFQPGFLINDISIVNSPGSPCTSSAMSFKGLEAFSLQRVSVTGFVNNIVIDTSNLVSFETVISRSSVGTGITFSSVYNSGQRVVGCVNNSSSGLSLNADCFNITTNNNFYNNNGAFGVQITGNCNVINFLNSIIEYNQADGVTATASTTNINIVGCIVTRNTSGISYNGIQNSVTSCIVTNNSGTGIQTGSNGLVTGNHVASNGGIGVDMLTDSNNSVTGNTIHNNGSHGISITGATQFSTITGNTVYSNGGNGINIGGPAAGSNTVSSNICESNTGEGIHVESDDNVISECRSTGNTFGIRITATGNDNIASICNFKGNGTNISDAGTGTSLVGNKS